MINNNGIGQKIKGKAQIIKGNIQKATGHELKGTITKIRGKANDSIANMKLQKRGRSAVI